MHTCKCSSDSTVSSTSSDPVYFQELIQKITKCEDLLDDSLYTYVKAKVHLSEIGEKLETARQAGTGLILEAQTELATLITHVTNSGLVRAIEYIEDAARKVKNKI